MTRRIDVPLFTSYLFVGIQSPWTPIAHTIGVNRLMMAGQTPYILPEGAVSVLRGAEAFTATNPPGKMPAIGASGDVLWRLAWGRSAGCQG